MGEVLRFRRTSSDDLTPDDAGDLVLFADVEEALRDSKRLAWLRPLLDSPMGDLAAANRLRALGWALREGLRGNALVDKAMQACPE